MEEIRDFVILRKGDRVRFYLTKTTYKDGTVRMGGKVNVSGCFVDYDDGTYDILMPERFIKLK